MKHRGIDQVFAFTLGTTVLALVSLKLFGLTSLPWWAVLLPLWLPWAFAGVLLVLVMAVAFVGAHLERRKGVGRAR